MVGKPNHPKAVKKHYWCACMKDFKSAKCDSKSCSHLITAYREVTRDRSVLGKCFLKFNVYKNVQRIVNADSDSVGLALGP